MKFNLKPIELNHLYVPNRPEHINKWAYNLNSKKSFTSKLTNEDIKQIMELNDVSNEYKLLLLMGIGVFIDHKNEQFTEIMKQLANNQRLYLIIASSDYIYGTNYQFCHAYLGKGLKLTQEKIIQALGRIGRSNAQQDYTVRLRDDDQIYKLFETDNSKIEARNMNNLFL